MKKRSGLPNTHYPQITSDRVDLLKELHGEDIGDLIDLTEPYMDVGCPLANKEFLDYTENKADYVYKFMPLLGALQLLYGLFSEFPPMEGESLKLSCGFLKDAQDKINTLYAQYGDDSPFDQKTLLKFIRHGFDIPSCWLDERTKDGSYNLPRIYGYGEKKKNKSITIRKTKSVSVIDSDRIKKRSLIYKKCLEWIEEELRKEPRTTPEILRMAELQWPEAPWHLVACTLATVLTGECKLKDCYLSKDWDTGKLSVTDVPNSKLSFGYEFICHMGWDRLITPRDIKKKSKHGRVAVLDSKRKILSHEDFGSTEIPAKKRGRSRRSSLC